MAIIPFKDAEANCDKSKHGGMDASDAKRLKALEDKNNAYE